MKRIQIATVCLLAVAGMALTGCTKESGKVSLTAQLGGGMNDDKVYINENRYPAWESGDEVWVNGQTLAVSNIRGTRANIEGVDESADGYWAVYPAEMAPESGSTVGSTLDFTIPRAQNYESDGTDQKIYAPMVAYTTTKTLKFKNVCSLVRVRVTNSTGSDFTVKRIVVNSNSAITGSASATVSDNVAGVPTITTGYHDAVLQMNGHANATVASDATVDYYVIVAPMQSASNVTVTLYTDENKYQTAQFAGVTLPQSQQAPVNMTVTSLQSNDFINGHFTVNASGKQVRFSKGNLQFYNSTSNFAGRWRFAQHQYDYVGNGTTGNVGSTNTNKLNNTTTANRGVTGNAWIDLFIWGSGNNPSYYSTSNSTFTEWTGMGSQWYTLSSDEWNYLINSRTPTTNPRFLKATVNNVKGLILFPDVFAWPSDVTTPTNINVKNVAFATTTVTLADWEKLEEEGAVFLPAGGYRSGRNTIYDVQTEGYYWAKDEDEASASHGRTFRINNDAMPTQASLSKARGHCVRLVQDVQ